MSALYNQIDCKCLSVKKKKKVFSHEPNKNKHQSRFDLWVMVCNPWLDSWNLYSEAWKAKVFQNVATVYFFPSCFPVLPLYTALAKLKCLSFTVNHLYLPWSSPLSMLFPTWALNIKIVQGSAQMSPSILSLFLNLQLELTLYSFENPQDGCSYFRSLVHVLWLRF